MKKDKPKPLPPGTYTGTVKKFRKKRSKPYYIMTLDVDGVILKQYILIPKAEAKLTRRGCLDEALGRNDERDL